MIDLYKWLAGKWLMAFAAISLAVAAPAAAKTFRIGYIEAGEYFTYANTYEAMVAELREAGWADKVVFPPDAHYSPGWAPEIKDKVLPQKARELMARDDIDLIIAAGTSANREILKANNGRTPILGVAVSDALQAGLIKSLEDSGVDNYTVRIVPGRFRRMFQIFHDVVGFKKLGLMYWDDASRNSAANADDAHAVARTAGFEIIEYKLKTERTEDCLAGLKTMAADGMDAFFMPSLPCFDWAVSDVSVLIDYLNSEKIPTFARQGTRDVQAGALMGFSTIDFQPRGRHHVAKMIKILEGAKPRDLPMVDNAPPKITLNLATAKAIDFDPPFDILASSDEIFQKVTLPEDRFVK